MSGLAANLLHISDVLMSSDYKIRNTACCSTMVQFDSGVAIFKEDLYIYIYIKKHTRTH